MPTINEAAVLRFYVDTQGYSDRVTAIEAQAASSIATHKTEVAAAIAQVNLTQSQTITALTLEVSNLKTSLTTSITATQTELINKADQLRTELTDIAQQLTQDSAAITQEIQDALDYLKDDAAVASALRTPRKIQGVDFDGTQDISLPVFSTQTDGLVPKRIGATADNYLREDGTWVVPTDTTYALLTKVTAEEGTATVANTISAQVLKEAIQYHAPVVTNIAGNAGTATKLQTPCTINGVSFDGTQNILLPSSGEYSLPTASASELGGIKVGSGLAISNSVLSVGTLNQSTTGNAATASKLQTARTISLTGKVTGSVSFDGSNNASIATAITGLGVANGIATLDSNGQVPSTQLPSYVDDVLEYANVAAFPTTGETGKIYVETTGNTTYRWGGTAYVKITSGDVSSVAGKTGIVNLSKADVGLAAVDNTADSSKSVASASKLTVARTIGGVSFNGTANINLPGVNTTGNQSTTGNAATASKLVTPVQINGVNFDGSQSIDIVISGGGGGSTSYADTAGKLANPVQIHGVNFDGTGDINLDVYNKSEVDTAIANATLATRNATEVVTGIAKIATTAIAQAGVNDTDVITAKKLRDALNARGNAPVSACRAWVCFNGKASPPVILSSLNISSVVKNASGDYTLNFTTPLEHSNYAVSCGGATGVATNKFYPCVKAAGTTGVPALKTPTQLGIVCISTSSSTSLVDMSEIYVEVFC